MTITTKEQRVNKAKSKLNSIVKKFVSNLKQGGVKIGDVEIQQANGNEFFVSIETSEANQQQASDLKYEIEKNSDLLAVDIRFSVGHYIWDADVYIRPSIYGTFKVQ
jgi:hypothetical protein